MATGITLLVAAVAPTLSADSSDPDSAVEAGDTQYFWSYSVAVVHMPISWLSLTC